MPVTQKRYLRVAEIIGRGEITPEQAAANRERNKGPKRARAAIPPIIRVSNSTWWAWVKSGRVPQPTYIGDVPVWSDSDIDQLGKGAA